MRAPSTRPDTGAYGVYLEDYTIGGRPVLRAVDGAGELRALRPVPPELAVLDAGRRLLAWLERRHPRPQLALVREPERPMGVPRPLTAEEQLLATPKSTALALQVMRGPRYRRRA